MLMTSYSGLYPQVFRIWNEYEACGGRGSWQQEKACIGRYGLQ